MVLRPGNENFSAVSGSTFLNDSGRRQPRRGQRQRIVLDDQPTLRRRVHTGRLEVGHLPVTDLGLGKIVQGQRPADPASLSYTTISNSRRPIVSCCCLDVSERSEDVA